MTTLSDAQIAINDRFITEWGSITPFAFTNEDGFDNDVDISWVRLTSQLAISGQHTLGKKTNRRYERRGIIFIQVFTPVNIGSKPANDLALQAQNIYEGEEFDSVVCFDSIIREIGIRDAWYQLQVEVNFLFEETK